MQELRDLIRTVPDFPQPGVQFRDVTPLLADAAGLAGAVELLAGYAQRLRPQAIAGIEARGFVFGAALALKLGTGFIPLRKAGKLPVSTLAEDYALEYGSGTLECDPATVKTGQRVVLVDDLIATGGTAIAGAKLLQRAGAICDDALFVIDLPDLAGMKALANHGLTGHALVAFAGH